MKLKQLAKKAMSYLDSVGVAAEYEIAAGDTHLIIETNYKYGAHIVWSFDDYDKFMAEIKDQYPLKSPN